MKYVLVLEVLLCLLFLFYNYLKKNDSELKYVACATDFMPELLIYIILLHLSYEVFGLSIQLVGYGFLMILLKICADMDIETLYIYRGLSVGAIVAGFIYMVTTFVGTDTFFYSKAFIVVNLLVFIGVLFLSMKFSFGMGDFLVFIGVAEFLVVRYPQSSYMPLIILMVCYTMAIFFFILLNIKKIDFKKFKMKERRPYIPAIFLATFCCIFLLEKFLMI